MTAKKWHQLSQDAQNSSILHWVDPTTEATPESVRSCQKLGMFGLAPDFVNDLNAMHEAEKSIPLVKLECYWKHLVRICSHPRLMLDGVEHGAVAIRATAAQRAEAFVLTMEAK